MKKVITARFFIGVLLLPLFFINVKDSHDWGDDFAQYLIQSRNIIEGRSQTDNGLISENNFHAYAIAAYPVGLPLLITPVYFFAKLNIRPYDIFISLALFITGIFCFEFFRRRTSLLFSVFLTLLFCYNFQVLELKDEILSEIPFTCLVMVLLVWTESKFYKKGNSFLITGLLLAYIASLRLAGFAIIAGYLFFELIRVMRENRSFENFLKLIYSTLVCALIFILLNVAIFPIGIKELLEFYENSFQSHPLHLNNNLHEYFLVSQYVFPFFGNWIPAIWIILALTGWLLKCIQSITLSEFIFLIYVVLIIFYPYSEGGIRFLIPVFPLLIYYLGYFIKFIFTPFRSYTNNILAVIYSIMLLAYMSPLKSILSKQNNMEEGPQQESSVAMFNFVKSLPKESEYVFCRARAFSLYTGRRVLYPTREQSTEETFNQFRSHKNLFLVYAKSNTLIYDPKLGDLLLKHDESFKKIWENENFIVYGFAIN